MKFLRDILERGAVAFAGTFGIVFTDFSAGRSAAYAAGVAAVTAIVGGLAALTGTKGSASLDPRNVGVVEAAHRR